MTRKEYKENVKKAIDLNTKSKSLCNEVLSQSLGQINKAYNEGFNDAQEIVNKFVSTDVEEVFRIFGKARIETLEKFTLQEVKEKLEDAKESEKEADFRIGDVVRTKYAPIEKAVIVSLDGGCNLRFKNGQILRYSPDDVVRTGENVDVRYYDYGQEQ